MMTPEEIKRTGEQAAEQALAWHPNDLQLAAMRAAQGAARAAVDRVLEEAGESRARWDVAIAAMPIERTVLQLAGTDPAFREQIALGLAWAIEAAWPGKPADEPAREEHYDA